MSFIKDYKTQQRVNAGLEVIPIVKMAEIEGQKFTVKNVKLQYDAENYNGELEDRAILTIIVNNEKRTLFIHQKWLFEMFESAVNSGYVFTEKDTFVLRKKTKGDKTFWDIDEN